jgi:hypothetical protein
MKKKPYEYPNENLYEEPYKILGVDPTITDEELKNEYSRLIKLLHPDKPLTTEAIKQGWTPESKLDAYFAVKNAYANILQLRQVSVENKYPDYNMDYNIDSDFTIPMDEIIDPKENMELFNLKFAKQRELDIKNGFEDPFNKGYSQFDNVRDYNDTKAIKNIPARADISVVKDPIVEKRSEDLIVRDYFSDYNCYGSSSFVNNGYQLGASSVGDFSIIDMKGSVPTSFGTDLMAVYGANYEYWEDTVKRNEKIYEKYQDTSSVTRKMNSALNSRDDTVFSEYDPEMEDIRKQYEEQKILVENARKLQLMKEQQYYAMKNIKDTQPSGLR